MVADNNSILRNKTKYNGLLKYIINITIYISYIGGAKRLKYAQICHILKVFHPQTSHKSVIFEIEHTFW